MNTLTATLKDGRTIEYLPDMIGEGGMKRVYLTADRQSVVCFYKDKSAGGDPNRIARLESILGRFNPTVNSPLAKYFSELFCWPTGIIVKPDFGVMTPVYPSNFKFASGNWKGKDKQGRWFSSPKLRKMLPPVERGDWLGYLNLCTLMARATQKMHLTGLAHSDLSCMNVLVDPPSGKCVIIDIDSLVVPGVFNPDVLGTPGYIAPEVLATLNLPLGDPKRKLPSNLTDLHALAVLIYEYLLKRHPLRGPKIHAQTAEEDERLAMGERALFVEHPKDSSNRPTGLTTTIEHLGPYLSALFIKAFVDGLHEPRNRPAAGDWEAALAKSSDLRIQCGNPACEDKWFIYKEGSRPKCPSCSWGPRGQIPLLEFFYTPRAGQFLPEKHVLVGYLKRELHKWHVFRNVRPGPNADNKVYAHIEFQQGNWLLVNDNLDSMISPGGNPVPKGKGCLLKEGNEIRLSKEEHGRLVSIKMI